MDADSLHCQAADAAFVFSSAGCTAGQGCLRGLHRAAGKFLPSSAADTRARQAVLALARLSGPGSPAIAEPSTAAASLSAADSTGSCENPEERAALTDLYNACGGASWVGARGWLSNLSVCNWSYVACDGSCRVDTLSLVQKNLVGSIPASLGALRHLVVLNLVESGVSGPLPAAALSQLTSLDRLLLGGGLTNAVTDLCALISMRSFRLSDTAISGELQGITCFEQLEEVVIANSRVSGTLPAVLPSRMSHIQVSRSRISGTLPQWPTSGRLEWLDLHQTSVSGTLPLSYASMPLTRLALMNTPVSGTLSLAFASWTNLTTLVLDGSLLSGTLDEAFAVWALDALSFSNTLVSGTLNPAFARLNLSRLVARQSPLSGTLHPAFARWTSLSQLVVAHSLVSGNAPRGFVVHLNPDEAVFDARARARRRAR